MRCISSPTTFWNKYAFPAIFVVILAAFVLPPFAVVGVTKKLIPFLFYLSALIAVAYVFISNGLKLLDEVYDDGDALVMLNGKDQVRVALSNISDIQWSGLRVKLALRQPCAFGDRLVFLARRSPLTFSAPSEIDDLIQRVEDSHRNTTADVTRPLIAE